MWCTNKDNEITVAEPKHKGKYVRIQGARYEDRPCNNQTFSRSFLQILSFYIGDETVTLSSSVKEIKGTRLLVSLHYHETETIGRADLEVFDLTNLAKVKKIYSFKIIGGKISYFDYVVWIFDILYTHWFL